MSRTVSIEELPLKAERLLRAAWEGREGVILERNGEPVAAIVPMDDYRRLYPETTAEPPASPLAYELPPDLLNAYHRLLDKKFSEGLTPEEEEELERVSKELGEVDLQTPLERAIDARARREHERRMSVLNEIISNLKSLRGSES